MNMQERAIAADRVLNDPFFKEAIAELRAEALEGLLSASPTDADGIRDKQALVKALDTLTGKFQGLVDASKLSKRKAE